MKDPTVDDVYDEAIARIIRSRDTYWLNDPLPADTGLYYCVRCHRHHYRDGSAIGERHAVSQPTPLPVRAEAHP